MSARQPALAFIDPVQPLSPLRPGTLHRDARLSDEQPNALYRWTLERRWMPGEPLLLYVGLNPSTANHLQDDPTVKAWIHFGRSWGFAGYIAVNPIPKRTPSPILARDWYEKGVNPVERDRILNLNDCYIREAAARCSKAVVCWGAAAWLPSDLIDRLYATLESAGHKTLYCVGRNADGSPQHFMSRGKNRIRRDAEMQIWRQAA